MTAPETVAMPSESNAVSVGSLALSGTSDWRAEGWEAMAKNATTGDAFRGLRKDGAWWNVTVRVLEGIMEGRHHCRFVYAGWQENGRYCETSWECFATLSGRIESLPNTKLIPEPKARWDAAAVRLVN